MFIAVILDPRDGEIVNLYQHKGTLDEFIFGFIDESKRRVPSEDDLSTLKMLVTIQKGNGEMVGAMQWAYSPGAKTPLLVVQRDDRNTLYFYAPDHSLVSMKKIKSSPIP